MLWKDECETYVSLNEDYQSFIQFARKFCSGKDIVFFSNF